MNCIFCGQETGGSYGGPDVCPSCDCGYMPDGKPLTYRQLTDPEYRERMKIEFLRNNEKQEFEEEYPFNIASNGNSATEGE